MFVWLELNVTHSVWRYATFWDYNRMSGYINKGDRFIFLSHDLRLSILALLRARVGNFCAHFAIKCSSFCQINVGTSKRSACNSLGFAFYPSVLSSNKLLERTGHVGYTVVFSICFLYLCYHHFSVFPSFLFPHILVRTSDCDARTVCLILLTTALGGVWTLEQPNGSLLEYYPVFRMMMRSIYECGGPNAVPNLLWMDHVLIFSILDRHGFWWIWFGCSRFIETFMIDIYIQHTEFYPAEGCKSGVVDGPLWLTNTQTSLWIRQLKRNPETGSRSLTNVPAEAGKG